MRGHRHDAADSLHNPAAFGRYGDFPLVSEPVSDSGSPGIFLHCIFTFMWFKQERNFTIQNISTRIDRQVFNYFKVPYLNCHLILMKGFADDPTNYVVKVCLSMVGSPKSKFS